MKKYTVFAVVLVMLVTATPVAGKNREPVGDRINISVGTPLTFAAGEPFHIMHGWGSGSPNDFPPGRFDFELEVDGVRQKEDFVWWLADQDSPSGMLSQLWVYNFPDGLEAGNHTFTGHWYAPCQYAGLCPTPNMKVEVFSLSLTVAFDA